ncbi:MAG: tyrosine-type recombinase/integrase [Clostridiales bacterium]|nr:tyrosine-type recombinase/integrase [Clostridiales bacterium]
MNNEIDFKSVFKEKLIGFVEEKQAIGYKHNTGISLLKRFDSYVYTLAIEPQELNKGIVLKWTERSPSETISTQASRISALRGFAEYLVRIGEKAYIYPKGMVTINRYSYTPYIFSKDEVMAIFTACNNFPFSKVSPYRHLIIGLLFRLIYCCGLRVSESTHLKVADVDLIEGTLYIRNAKFGKERLIPMSDELTKRCRIYYQYVLIGNNDDTYFFPTPKGEHYSESTIYKLFRKILWSAGISHTGKGPRIHDIRHTYAVHCLKKWVLEKKDISNCLPYLSVYLGHEDMRGTQHYLRLTADLYPDIIKKVDDSCSRLIPEVMTNEAD